MQSGIERLLQTKPYSRVQFLVGDDATWSKWANCDELQLWQAVALHSHLDPDLLLGWSELSDSISCTQFIRDLCDEPPSDADLEKRFMGNIEHAASALRGGELPAIKLDQACVENSTVSVSEFHAWATRASLRPVQGVPARGPNVRPAPSGWGSYSTPRLEQLRAAVELWRLEVDGGTYDPRKPWTAPHPEVVRATLAKAGVPDTLIDTYVSLARDPRLRPGPHPVAPAE